MTTAHEAVLAERCAALRAQLRANRLVIASRFDAADAAKNSYPRSVTMRLLKGPLARSGPRLIEAAILVLGSQSARLLVAAALARLIARFTART